MDMVWKTALAGAVGAMAPEIVRLYGLATGGQKLNWSPGLYIPASLAFAGLAAFIAAILPSGNLQSAFYTGVSTPVLVNAILRKARDGKGGEIPADASGGETKKAAPSAVPGAAPRLSRVDAFLSGL